jgi:hypothetical protein
MTDQTAFDLKYAQGVQDILKVRGGSILPVIPQLIVPLKKALDSKIPKVRMRDPVSAEHHAHGWLLA